MTMLHTISAILRARPLHSSVLEKPAEWLLASIMMGWAFTFALPGRSLDLPVYAAFRAIGLREPELSALFGALGAFRFAALYINGQMPRGPLVRQLCAFCGAQIWLVTALLLAMPWVRGEQPALGTGVATYAVLGLFELFSIRVAAADGRYRHS